MRLQGKSCVITGAATGIGAASAKRLAEEGASVVIGDINEEEALSRVKEIRDEGGNAWFVFTDVSQADDVKKLMEEALRLMGRYSVIFNNAGIQRSGYVTELKSSDWNDLMEVNPRSCFFTAKYGIPALREQGGGSIINMASIAGIKGGSGMTAYSASKGAIIAFSKALSNELADDNIRVNCICPGWIDTPFNKPAINIMGGRDRLSKFVRERVPLQRQGSPKEIAEAVLFLASDESSYMTGQTMVLDGGLL